jgi:RNA recognition motif. (a.k.a. RRM, RBD, or RNP domain)
LKLRNLSADASFFITTMARRLYLGSKISFVSFNTLGDLFYCRSGLPPDVRSEDVAKLFDGYGRIIDCRVMTGSPAQTLAQPADFKQLCRFRFR